MAPISDSDGDEPSSEHEQEDTDQVIQGLTTDQIRVLAHKVYDLLLEEMRIELERHGARGTR